MVDLEKIVEELSSLNVMEAAELAKKLEEKWGVSASAPMAMMAAPVTGGAEKVEEKTQFDVILVESGANKINVIKEVKAILNLGLKEAKDLVDSAPKTIKSGIKKEEADEIEKKLKAAGAKVEIK